MTGPAEPFRAADAVGAVTRLRTLLPAYTTDPMRRALVDTGLRDALDATVDASAARSAAPLARAVRALRRAADDAGDERGISGAAHDQITAVADLLAALAATHPTGSDPDTSGDDPTHP